MHHSELKKGEMAAAKTIASAAICCTPRAMARTASRRTGCCSGRGLRRHANFRGVTVDYEIGAEMLSRSPGRINSRRRPPTRVRRGCTTLSRAIQESCIVPGVRADYLRIHRIFLQAIDSWSG